MKCRCLDPVVFGCHCTRPWHGEVLPGAWRTLTSFVAGHATVYVQAGGGELTEIGVTSAPVQITMNIISD